MPSRHSLRLRGCVTLALAAALCAGPLASTTHADSSGEPTRILITGDSITEGTNGDTTWRARLWNAYKAAGVPIDFVGSRTTLRHGRTNYLDHSFDKQHAAIGGTWLQTQVGVIRREVTTSRAEVVVALLGTNDLNWGRKPAQVATDLRAYIGQIRAAAPGTAVVIGQVTPRPAVPNIGEYNTLAAQVVADLTTAESPVVMANVVPGFFSYDGSHPTPTGEVSVARQMAAGLAAVGVGSRAPVVPGVTGWTATLKPTVRLSGRRAVIRWNRLDVTANSVRVVSAITGTARYTGGGMTTKAIAPGRRVSFRLQARRGPMNGPHGPAVTVRAPGFDRVTGTKVKRGKRTVKVYWNATPGATSYKVMYRQTGKRYKTVYVRSTKKAFKVAQSGKYFVRVSARNGYDTGASRIVRVKAYR